MNKKIKILILTHTFPTKNNKIASIFLLNQLKELKKKCEIKVIYPHAYVPKTRFLNPYHKFSNIPEKEKIEGIEVYHPKYFMIPRIIPRFLNYYLYLETYLSYFASKKTVHKIVKEWNPDIIHMHGAISECLLGVELKKKYKKKLLLTVYGEDITKYSKMFPTKKLGIISLKNSDVIITQSKFMEYEIKKIGVDNKDFRMIPMGADLGKFKELDKMKARKLLNLPKNKKIILFIGHLIKRKGVRYLIKAVNILSKGDSSVLCLIIGAGDQEEKLKKIVSELDLKTYVKFLGRKNQEELCPYIGACDVFCLPSLNEGLPVVLCESLACGRPVVATKVAGTPELVTKDVGYLVKVKDVGDLVNKLLLAMNKKWISRKIIERGREFSVEKSAEKLVKLYNEVLK